MNETRGLLAECPRQGSAEALSDRAAVQRAEQFA